MKRYDDSFPRGVMALSMTTMEVLTAPVVAASGVTAGTGARAPMPERRHRRRLASDPSSIGDEAQRQPMLHCQAQVFTPAERQRARWLLANALAARDTHRSAAPTVH